MSEGDGRSAGPEAPPGAIEVDLVAHSLEGSEEAFAGLMRRYQEGLYRLVRGILRHSLLADEITQRAFFRTYRFLDLYAGDRPFRGWLYKTGTNLALSALRRRPIASYPSTTPQMPTDLEPMENLLPWQRTVLVLRSALGLAYHEIALILGIPEETVMERLQQAREAFSFGTPEGAWPDAAACGPIRSLLGPYEDAELSRVHRKRVEEHMELCPSCRAILEAIRECGWRVRTETFQQDPGPEYFEELPGRFRQSHDLATQRAGWTLTGKPARRPPTPSRSGRLRWPHFLWFLALLAVAFWALREVGTPPLRPRWPWENPREASAPPGDTGTGPRSSQTVDVLLQQEGNPDFPDSLWSASWRIVARARARQALQSRLPQDREAAVLDYWRIGHRQGRELYPDSTGQGEALKEDLEQIRALLRAPGR